jgi:molybdate transport system ATP-binding protein
MGTGRMSLRARIEVERQHFRLDLDLDVSPGEIVALLGPNGAGKSTTLRALAGLEALDNGRIQVDDEVWEDTTKRGRLAPEQRSIGVVFADHLLFPHLSALENVAFGPRAHGVPKSVARELANDWLRRVGLGEYAKVKPGRLSSGQAQRVAVARALAVRPRVLLLDEPLAALDVSTRAEIRAELGRQLRAYEGICVFVTHDPLDAMVLADRLIVLEHGHVTQHGAPTDVASTPRTEYVARLVGLNLYRGEASNHVVRLAGGGELTIAESIEGAVFVTFRPSAVALFPNRSEGSPRNRWPVTVSSVERHGDVVRVHGDGTVPVLADLTPAAIAELQLAPGSKVWAAVKATEITSYPA